MSGRSYDQFRGEMIENINDINDWADLIDAKVAIAQDVVQGMNSLENLVNMMQSKVFHMENMLSNMNNKLDIVCNYLNLNIN